MASLTIDATKVHVITFDDICIHEGVAGAALTGGKYTRLDATTGKLVAATGASAGAAGNIRWLTLKTVASGDAVSGFRGALIDLGLSALDGLNFGVPLYLADDGGITATIGESTAATVVGWVVPGWASGSSADRLFQQAW